jgi:protein gp37
LLAVKAELRFLSCEPLLEPVDLTPWLKDGGIGWVIVGGESNQGGAAARPFDLEACESVVGQCRDHGVPVFVKQFGSNPVAGLQRLRLLSKHGSEPEEWPNVLQVRQEPTL